MEIVNSGRHVDESTLYVKHELFHCGGGPIEKGYELRAVTYVVAFRCQPDAGRFKRMRVLYHLQVRKWD